MFRLRWLGSFGLAAVLLVSPPAAAEDDATRSAARTLALDGIAALQKGDAALASQKLEKSYQLLKVPSVALWSARALVKAGKLVEASERYVAATHLSFKEGEQAVQEQAKKDAAAELDALMPRIPKLLLELQGAPAGEVTLSVDGASFPSALLGEERPINPGAHELVATYGDKTQKRTVQIAEGAVERVTLDFGQASPAGGAMASGSAGAAPSSSGQAPSASSQPAPSRSKVPAIAAFAGAGVGLAVGGITAALALGKRQALEDGPNCDANTCAPVAQGEVDSFRTLRTVSTIGFVAGGVLAATGVVLLVTKPSAKSSQGQGPAKSLALRVRPGGLDFEGTF